MPLQYKSIMVKLWTMKFVNNRKRFCSLISQMRVAVIITSNVSKFGNVMQVEFVNFSAHVQEAEMEVVN